MKSMCLYQIQVFPTKFIFLGAQIDWEIARIASV